MSIEDFLYPFLNSYNALPLSLRNFLGKAYRLIPSKIRYGNFYESYRRRIKSFQRMNFEQVEAEARLLLLKTVRETKDTIPFYRDYSQISCMEDFKNLPIVTKETINPNLESFINESKKNKGLKSNTGGSSGTPFSFLIEKGITRSKEISHFDWFWGRHGYKKGDKILMIRGKSLKRNADYEFQTIGNKLVISCYNLNQNSLSNIFPEILKFKPDFIHAYPSALLSFSKELQLFRNDKNFPGFQVKGLFLGSEALFKEDEKFFREYYNSKVVSWYGHSECLLHAEKCQLTGNFHFFPFYGYMELLDEKGNTIEKPGVEGRIVATGFDNSVMPLLRYDTGDIGIYTDKNKCECGFIGKSLTQIAGRGKDYIILEDNTKVTLTALIFGQHHQEFQRIKELQIIQNKPGEILLKLVPLTSISSIETEQLKNRLIRSVNGLLSVEIQEVELIQKTHRGKHKILIQNLEI